MLLPLLHYFPTFSKNSWALERHHSKLWYCQCFSRRNVIFPNNISNQYNPKCIPRLGTLRRKLLWAVEDGLWWHNWMEYLPTFNFKLAQYQNVNITISGLIDKIRALSNLWKKWNIFMISINLYYQSVPILSNKEKGFARPWI